MPTGAGFRPSTLSLATRKRGRFLPSSWTPADSLAALKVHVPQTSICVYPGKNKHTSNCERFPLKPTGQKQIIYIYIYIHFSKWKQLVYSKEQLTRKLGHSNKRVSSFQVAAGSPTNAVLTKPGTARELTGQAGGNFQRERVKRALDINQTTQTRRFRGHLRNTEFGSMILLLIWSTPNQPPLPPPPYPKKR